MLRAMTRTVSVKSSRERVRATWSSTLGMTRVPTSAVKATRPTTFSAVHRERQPRAANGRRATEEGGQHDKRDDGEEILHHQPAHGHVARRRVQMVVIGEDPHQHDGAGHPEREPEDDRPPPSPSRTPGPAARQAAAATPLCREGAGNRDAPDRQQLLHVELQAHAEHQQDDADLGQLLGYRRIGDEARRVRADHRPAIRYPTIGDRPMRLREVAEHQRGGEAAGEREDQAVAVHSNI